MAAELKGGGVSSVWLQFGVRLDDLDRELLWLRGAFPALEVVGSVFLPTEKADRAAEVPAVERRRAVRRVPSGPGGGGESDAGAARRLPRSDVRPLVEAPGRARPCDGGRLRVVRRARAGEEAPFVSHRYRRTCLALASMWHALCTSARTRPTRSGFAHRAFLGIGRRRRLLHYRFKVGPSIGVQGVRFYGTLFHAREELRRIRVLYSFSLRSSKSPGSTQIAPTL